MEMQQADTSTAIVALKSPSDHLSNDRGREYRKGNWTLHETMVLIAGKKLDDERRLKGCDRQEKGAGRYGEFRWKWVENYCWKNNCERSQNQCNDKWDNLLRDYKKVRDYELGIRSSSSSSAQDQNNQQQQQRSYWQLDKQERKTRGLPSNLLIQVFEALHEIVEKKAAPATARPALMINSQVSPPTVTAAAIPVSEKPCSSHQPQRHLPAPPSIEIPPPASAEVSKTTSSEEREDQSNMPPESKHEPKKRRVSGSGGSVEDGVSAALTKGLSELSQALLSCEERRDRRHKDLVGVEERKLELEQTKAEIARQGVEGLITAVNNLAGAILTLVTDRK